MVHILLRSFLLYSKLRLKLYKYKEKILRISFFCQLTAIFSHNRARSTITHKLEKNNHLQTLQILDNIFQ